MTRDEKIDLVMLALVISWPFMLGIGILLWLAHVPLWAFFVYYCLASSWGIFRAAKYFLEHGVHDR